MDIDIKSPTDYLSGNRTGDCLEVPHITYMLLKLKGETVRIAGARNVNYCDDPRYLGAKHDWVEIEINDEWYAIDYNQVTPLEEWYQTYDWSIDLEKIAP